MTFRVIIAEPIQIKRRFPQGDVTHELQKHAEPLPGGPGHRDRHQDQQHGQLGAGQPQPQLPQHHLHAQAAAGAPALHHQQVPPSAAGAIRPAAAKRSPSVAFCPCSMSGFGMNRNQVYGLNHSLSSNIFNGTGLAPYPSPPRVRAAILHSNTLVSAAQDVKGRRFHGITQFNLQSRKNE